MLRHIESVMHKLWPIHMPTGFKHTTLREVTAFLSRGSYAALLAPWYTDDLFPAGDGYCQRIRMIDDKIFSGVRRLYIYNSPLWTARWIGCFRTDCKDVRYLVYNDSHSAQIETIRRLIDNARLCYIHSVYRVLPSIPVGGTEHFVHPKMIGTKKILDLHGFVSAELEMSGFPEARITMARAAEKKWLAASDCVISVTHNMLTCMEDALHVNTRQSITLPVMGIPPLAAGVRTWKKSGPNEAPIVMYSGGLQVWQQIDQMIHLAEATPLSVHYRFFVNKPDEMQQLLDKAHAAKAYHLNFLPADALREEYARADFGFILRDDSLVNRVACPTKMIDYLFHGIIPIVHSAEIGDFRGLGMQYVTDVDFAEGRLPDELTREQMRWANLAVIEKLLLSCEDGLDTLKRMVHEG